MQKTDAHKELIADAKALGIKAAHMYKPEKLEEKIAEVELSKQSPAEFTEKPKGELLCEIPLSEFDRRYLKSIQFDLNWFASIANQYGVEKFQYLHKFRAFRAYKGGRHVDWISINDVGLLNNKRDVCEILLKHGDVAKERRLFNFHWRV